MRIDEETGVVYIVEEDCIGCGKCVKNCKFDPPRISIRKAKNRKQWKAVKCDLCRDNPEGPQCIKYCIVRCIGLSDDSVMLAPGVVPTYAQEEKEPANA